jgi:hypothetical protein
MVDRMSLLTSFIWLQSHALWYTPSSTFSFAPPSQLPYVGNVSGSPPNSPSNNQGQNQHARHRNVGISPLAQLEADEQLVALRKLNIQRFGATWIRPPGMAKTYQGELDEKAEREEAEAQEIMDDIEMPGEGGFDLDEEGQHDNTDLDANIPDGGDVSDLDGHIPEADSFVDGAEDEDEDEEEEEEDGEVDLDDDIPEAEAETLWDDSDEEEDEEYEDNDHERTGYASVVNDAISSFTARAGSVVNDAIASFSTRAGSEGFGISSFSTRAASEESPQHATFSHDERFPDDRRQRSGREYDWRARARYRRSVNDSMEVDSDE